MNNQLSCVEWKEYIVASLHLDGLTPSQRTALASHLAICSTCTETYADYTVLAARIRMLPTPVVQPLPRFPPLPQQSKKQAQDYLPPDRFLHPKRTLARSTTWHPPFIQHINMLVAFLIISIITGTFSLIYLYLSHYSERVHSAR